MHEFELVLAAEINRVRGSLFNWSVSKDHQRLPEPCGPVVTITEKLFVPLHEHPDVSYSSAMIIGYESYREFVIKV